MYVKCSYLSILCHSTRLFYAIHVLLGIKNSIAVKARILLSASAMFVAVFHIATIVEADVAAKNRARGIKLKQQLGVHHTISIYITRDDIILLYECFIV